MDQLKDNSNKLTKDKVAEIKKKRFKKIESNKVVKK